MTEKELDAMGNEIENYPESIGFGLPVPNIEEYLTSSGMDDYDEN